MLVKSVDKVGKDVKSIIDKYLHRDKWEVVNDEYIKKYLPYWSEYYQCFDGTININDRELDDSTNFIRDVHTFPYDGLYKGKIPDNYVYAKLYN